MELSHVWMGCQDLAVPRQHQNCDSPRYPHGPPSLPRSYDAMLDLKGNTAVYLLYAHARIAGIVRKV